MGKLGVLAVGALLIIGVLFIGYKMDNVAPKAPKASKKKAKARRAKEDYEEEDYDDPYKTDDFVDTEDDDYEEYEEYEEDEEEEVAEEDDESSFFSSDSSEEDEDNIFDATDELESSFDSDIDNELSFEAEDTVKDSYDDIDAFAAEIEHESEEIAQEIEEPAEELVEEVEEVVEEKPKKRGRPKKSAKEEPVVAEEEEIENPYDFSSTMVFDTDKLTNDLEEIDSIDNAPIKGGFDSRLDIFGGTEAPAKPEPKKEVSDGDEIVDPYDFSATIQELTSDDYSAPVYDIDDKIEALDEEAPKAKPEVEGPFKPADNEAESFMNELKRMQESAEAEDFEGFVVETKSEALKETHKKYTKKKEAPVMEEPQISFIPEEEPEEDEPISSGMDMNFLEQMEKNLKDNQKERLNKKTSKQNDDEDEE